MSCKITLTRKTSILLFIAAMIITVPSNYAVKWSPDTRLTTDAGADWMPSITSTTDGGIWAVWRSDRMGDDEIYYNVFDGYSWLGDTRLTSENHTDTYPAVMQASDEKIWVVWTSDRMGNPEIYYNVFDGYSWLGDTRLTSENHTDLRPAVMQASDEKIWVVWESGRTGDAEIFCTVYNGTSWTDATQVTNDTSAHEWDPSIMQTQDGSIWVAFTKTVERPGTGYKEDIYYKIFNGSSWTREFRFTFDDNNHESSPSIMQTINGSIWFVWDSDIEAPLNKIFYRFYDGNIWSEDTKLSPYLADEKYPSITQATDHTIWVAWGSMRGTANADIYYKIMMPHDVAISEVTVPVDWVIRGETVSFNVTAMNTGTENETFTVQSYVNAILLASETIFLTPRQTHLFTYQWNTTDFRSGSYVISATALAVPREVELDDNSLSDLVEVRIIGDICGRYDGVLLPIPDFWVDIEDFMIAVCQFGTSDPSWNEIWGPACDLNQDGTITTTDLLTIAIHYGET